MANRIKKLLITIAIASIALSSMPDPGVSASTSSGSGISVTQKVKIKGNTYKISGKKAALIKVPKTKKSLIVPASIKYKKKKYRVTSISACAAKNHKKLKSVSIGKYVKTIGKEAFMGCSKLKKLQISSVKLKTIGEGAFIGISGKYQYEVPETFFKKYTILLKSAGLGKKKVDKSESDPGATATPAPTKTPKSKPTDQPVQEAQETPVPTKKIAITTTPSAAPTNTGTPTPTPLPNKRYVIAANIAIWDDNFLIECDEYGVERPIYGSVYDICEYTYVWDSNKNKWIPIETEDHSQIELDSTTRMWDKVEQHPSFIELNKKLSAKGEQCWDSGVCSWSPTTIYLKYIWEDDKGNVIQTQNPEYDIAYMGSYEDFKKTGKPDPDAYSKWLVTERKWVEENLKSSNPELREAMNHYKSIFPDLFK